MALNDATGIESLDGDELPKIDPSQNPRNQRMMEIANEEAQHKKDEAEFRDIDTADYENKAPVEEEKEEVKEETQAPRKFKIKANGQEMELTEEELLKRAELAEGAEQKFQEAARLRREAEELSKELRQQQAPKLEAVPTVDDDDRALARALQMGSEEEAAAVVKRIRNSQAGLNPGQVAGMVEMITSGNWFRAEYPEIFSDPRLQKLALDEDERLVKSGDRRSYRDRYKAIGDELRKWKGIEVQKQADKQERKASLQVVPKADVKYSPASKEDDEGPTDAQYIAQEAKRRGQSFVR